MGPIRRFLRGHRHQSRQSEGLRWLCHRSSNSTRWSPTKSTVFYAKRARRRNKSYIVPLFFSLIDTSTSSHIILQVQKTKHTIRLYHSTHFSPPTTKTTSPENTLC